MKKRLLRSLTVLLVILIIAAASGTVLNPAVRVFAEEEKVSEPGLVKHIVLHDGTMVDEGSFSAGDEIRFTLESNVPEDLPMYTQYTLSFHDEMDAEMEMDVSSLCVEVNGRRLSAENYEFVLSCGGGENTVFSVQLDLIDLYFGGFFSESELGVAPVTVEYTARLKQNVQPGSYRNRAWVEYETGKTPDSTVIIDTYGLKIIKHADGERTHGLEGAEFEIYKILDDKKVTVADGLYSDENGRIEVSGLAEGIYYIIEKKAPEGYAMNPTPIRVEVGKGLDTPTVAVYVPNALINKPANTGSRAFFGPGVMMVISGSLVIWMGCAKRKRAS